MTLPVAAKVQVETYDLSLDGYDHASGPVEVPDGTIVTAKELAEDVNFEVFEGKLNRVFEILEDVKSKVVECAKNDNLNTREFSAVLDQLEVISKIGGKKLG